MKMKTVKADEDKIFRKLKPKEVVWILCVILLIALLSVKSVYFDPYKPVTFEDAHNLEIAKTFTEEHYDGFFYKYNVLDIRIIKLRAEEETISVQTRKYVFGFFPFGDQYFILDN